jgi:hypothetical protein
VAENADLFVVQMLMSTIGAGPAVEADQDEYTHQTRDLDLTACLGSYAEVEVLERFEQTGSQDCEGDTVCDCYSKDPEGFDGAVYKLAHLNV